MVFKTLDGSCVVKRRLVKGTMCSKCHKKLATGFFVESKYELVPVCDKCGRLFEKESEKLNLSHNYVPIEIKKHRSSYV